VTEREREREREVEERGRKRKVRKRPVCERERQRGGGRGGGKHMRNATLPAPLCARVCLSVCWQHTIHLSRLRQVYAHVNVCVRVTEWSSSRMPRDEASYEEEDTCVI
jgi:hypothetical protein